LGGLVRGFNGLVRGLTRWVSTVTCASAPGAAARHDPKSAVIAERIVALPVHRFRRCAGAFAQQPSCTRQQAGENVVPETLKLFPRAERIFVPFALSGSSNSSRLR